MTDPRLICGDCLEVLPTLEENSVDLIATDPPYAINFMGREWDKSLPDPAIWREALRVAKPGAFAFVMCTPRSDCLWRMCRDLEEAGWDLTHAQMYWIYRGGFPKALDIGKDFDRAAFVEWVKAGPAEAMGWGPEEIRKAASAAVNGLWEKPGGPRSPETKGGSWAEGTTLGHQPDRDDAKALLASLLARFPDAPGVRVKVGEYRVGGNALTPTSEKGGTYGVGVPNSEPGNLPITSPSTPLALAWDGWKSPGLKPACECIIVCQKPFSGPVRENVRKWGVGGFNVEAARIPFAGNIPAPAQHQHMESGAGGMMTSAREDVTSDKNGTWWEPETGGRFPANLLCSDLALGEVGSLYFDVDKWSEEHGIDEDGWAEAAAAGLVQVAKPSKGEKEEGLLDLKAQAKRPAGNAWSQQTIWNGENGDAAWRKKNPNLPARNHHPTCKPVRLMSYLIHLACPPGGLVLDPFMGSGTTGVAAVKGHWGFIGIELEPEYITIAEQRIAAARLQAPLPLPAN
jgi:16S rRNA G966 N2-methylase RsmD